MQNHEENLASRVNGSLQPLLGVTVTVKTPTGLLATIYSDDGVTVQPNPMFTNANGLYGFRAANGPYKLTFSGPQIESYERDIDLYDPDDAQPLTQAQAALPSATERIGHQPIGASTPVTLSEHLRGLESSSSPDARFAYRKRVLKRFPRLLPDEAALVATYGAHGGYQSFTIDHVARELFLCSVTKQIVSVFDWDTSEYKRSFSLGAATVVTENLVVRYEGNSRFLYARSSNSSLHKYDITVLPTSLSTVSSVTTVDIGVDRSFSFQNGQWTVEDRALPLSGKRRRHRYIKYDTAFQRTGDVDFGLMNSGAGEDSLYGASGVPKHQGMCEYQSGYLLSFGGSWATGQPVDPYSYQGVKTFTGTGQLVLDALMRPDLMRDTLLAQGVPCTKIENEGVHVAPDGQMISMYITLVAGDSGSSADGVVFLEEFSRHPAAVDFSPCAVSFSVNDVRLMQTGLFPRSYPGDKMYNPVTGAAMETWDALIDFMAATDMTTLRYYSSSVSINDFAGAPVPNGYVVEITNANNSTFWIEATGFGVARYWRVSGAPGARVQAEHFPSAGGRNVPYILAQSGVSSAVITGTTAETTVGTVTVPANALGPNGRLEIDTHWGCSNSANNKTLKVKFGGGIFFQPVATTSVQLVGSAEIRNAGATNSQFGGISSGANVTGLGNSAAAPATSAADTTVSQDITFTVTLANAADNAWLKGYTVTVFPG